MWCPGCLNGDQQGRIPRFLGQLFVKHGPSKRKACQMSKTNCFLIWNVRALDRKSVLQTARKMGKQTPWVKQLHLLLCCRCCQSLLKTSDVAHVKQNWYNHAYIDILIRLQISWYYSSHQLTCLKITLGKFRPASLPGAVTPKGESSRWSGSQRRGKEARKIPINSTVLS